jgi:hypothetical protein
VAAGAVVIEVSVGVGVSFASEVSPARVAHTGRGQSSAASGVSIGLSAMYSSGRLFPKGAGKFVVSTSDSEARPSWASESESLYHMVP